MSKFSNVAAQFDVHFRLHNKTLNYTSTGSTLAPQKSTQIRFLWEETKIFCKFFNPIFHISLWSSESIKTNDIQCYYLPVSARRLGMMAANSTHIENDYITSTFFHFNFSAGRKSIQITPQRVLPHLPAANTHVNTYPNVLPVTSFRSKYLLQ